MTRAGAALLAVLALAIAGCGSSSDDDAGKILYNAAKRTSQASGAHIDLTMGSQGQEIHLVGFEDFAGRRGTFTMTLPEIGDVDMVSDGEQYYFRYPPEVRKTLGIDTEWASADADAAGGSVFGDSGGFDAGQLLRQMATAGDVRQVGDATTGGVHAKRFHATVDLREVPDTVPADQRDAAKKALQDGLDAGLEPVVPLDVWVDDDAHVRRVEEQIQMKGQTIEVTIMLSDFGTRQDITVPQKATDITDELGD